MAAPGPPPLVRLLQEFTLEANRYVDAAGGRNAMHRTDLNALSVIMRHTARGEVVTPGVLRKELNLSSPATTALIDRLHSSGHVVRERQGTDRRQVQLLMTPKAYSDGGAMFLPLARHMGAALAGFTPEELEIATRFMNSMIEATIRAGEEAARDDVPRENP
jgi:DNA-binding MarR family transcriptional regulator